MDDFIESNYQEEKHLIQMQPSEDVWAPADERLTLV